MFLNMGYEALFFARLTDNDKNERLASKNMEFIWNPTFEAQTGSSSSAEEGLLTHVMYRHYNTPCNIEIQGYFNKGRITNTYASQLQRFNQNPS